MQPHAGDTAGHDIGIDSGLRGQFHPRGVAGERGEAFLHVWNEIEVLNQRALFFSEGGESGGHGLFELREAFLAPIQRGDHAFVIR